MKIHPPPFQLVVFQMNTVHETLACRPGDSGNVSNSVGIHRKYDLLDARMTRWHDLPVAVSGGSRQQLPLLQDGKALRVLRAGLQGESWMTGDLVMSLQSWREDSGGGPEKDLKGQRGNFISEKTRKASRYVHTTRGTATHGGKRRCCSDWFLSRINPLDPLKESQEQLLWTCLCVFPGLSLEACNPLASHSHEHSWGKHVAEEEEKGWKWSGNTQTPLCSAVKQARWPAYSRPGIRAARLPSFLCGEGLVVAYSGAGAHASFTVRQTWVLLELLHWWAVPLRAHAWPLWVQVPIKCKCRNPSCNFIDRSKGGPKAKGLTRVSVQ